MPAPAVVRKWIQIFCWETGFSDLTLNALKDKVEEYKTPKQTLLYSFMMDEMSIRKQVEFDRHCYRGMYVDFRFGVDND